jgi:hypothetical protein
MVFFIIKRRTIMRVCRTLDYIVNTDLHLFLFEKFDYARSKGIQIEIELTVFIKDLLIDSKEFIEVMELLLDSAFESISEFHEKKLYFNIGYVGQALQCVIQYPAYKCSKGLDLEKTLKEYKKVSYNIRNVNSVTTQKLVVVRD